MAKRGIIVGANEMCAWLLPWWWRHYSQHNTLPVTFFDFGLSQEAAAWCRARGELIPLDGSKMTVAAKEQIDEQVRADWEQLYGSSIWSVRNAWFCKPLACMMSPYEESLWLDLDCEVCGPLEEIFEALDSQAELGVCLSPSGPRKFSSGVLIFRKQAKLIERWAKRCADASGSCFGDDDVLSLILNDSEVGNGAFQLLPQRFNWMGAAGENLLLDLHSSRLAEALIIHWISLGKLFIETHGGYQEYIARKAQAVCPKEMPQP